ncbi:hypothetical protein KIPE111705_15430 [Kibdelosporangium persicum]
MKPLSHKTIALRRGSWQPSRGISPPEPPASPARVSLMYFGRGPAERKRDRHHSAVRGLRASSRDSIVLPFTFE